MCDQNSKCLNESLLENVKFFGFFLVSFTEINAMQNKVAIYFQFLQKQKINMSCDLISNCQTF